MVSEDRRTLARVRNLSADVDKPLSESYTYRRSDREPRDKQMVGTAAERVRREMTETAEFLEQSLKELDAAKAEEEEALSKVLMGPGDEERDKEFHRKMSELKQEAAALKRETLRKLAVVEEVRGIPGRPMVTSFRRLTDDSCIGVRRGEERNSGRTLAPELIAYARLLRKTGELSSFAEFKRNRDRNLARPCSCLAVRRVCETLSVVYGPCMRRAHPGEDTYENMSTDGDGRKVQRPT